jgi:ABC-type transport system involved in Fe-S cluster assembly fused permease/ATPase subunit
LRASRNAPCGASRWKSFATCTNSRCAFTCIAQTGGVSRDIERGSRSISNLISYTLYSILPTLVEIGLVLAILFARYDSVFVLITLASLGAYVVFTVKVSNWRIAIDESQRDRLGRQYARHRQPAQLRDGQILQQRGIRGADATTSRCNDWEDAATRSQVSLSWLNLGQQVSIALGVTAMMWRAASGVVAGTMTIGDLVLVNAFLIQLYMPLNFLGVVYREIRQSLADIERMFDLLAGQPRNRRRAGRHFPARRPAADPLSAQSTSSTKRTARFSHGVDFAIPAGRTRSPWSASRVPENRPWRAFSTASTMSAAVRSGSTGAIFAN